MVTYTVEPKSSPGGAATLTLQSPEGEVIVMTGAGPADDVTERSFPKFKSSDPGVAANLVVYDQVARFPISILKRSADALIEVAKT